MLPRLRLLLHGGECPARRLEPCGITAALPLACSLLAYGPWPLGTAGEGGGCSGHPQPITRRVASYLNTQQPLPLEAALRGLVHTSSSQIFFIGSFLLPVPGTPPWCPAAHLPSAEAPPGPCSMDPTLVPSHLKHPFAAAEKDSSCFSASIHL